MKRENLWVCALALLGACAFADTGEPGGGEEPLPIESEIRGGRFHAAAASNGDLDELLATAAVDLPELGGIRAGHFAEPSRFRAPAHGGQMIAYVTARQQVGGVPVRGGYVHFAVREGAEARLGASSYHLYGGGGVDAVPSLARAEAEAIAVESVRLAAPAVRDAALELEPREGRLQLVWNVTLEGHHERVMIDANGALAGRARVVDDRWYDADGHVRGHVATGGAPKPGAVTELVGLPSVEVSSGGELVVTDAMGAFAVGGEGATVEARLSGEAAVITDVTGPELEAGAAAGSGLSLELGDGASEAATAQVTAYYYTDRVRAFLISHGASPEELGAPLSARVNLASSCNAYYSPAARTINFFRSSSTCHNTAEASIVAHEYGHFADDVYGGITNGGLSEGWGDLLACLLLEDPRVGREFFKTGDAALRRCDNDYTFPPSGHDEVHALGQAWAGFGWHLREELVALYGEQEGHARARDLLLPSLYSNAPDIPAAVREVVVRDDDDGDAGNGTPHWDQIEVAAQRHALGFVLDDDLSAPGAIGGFEAEATSGTTIELRWTAPGDDGDDGTAASYELRWSTAPIDDDSFGGAQTLDAPAPLPAGSGHSVIVTVPPGGSVHFAIRAVDDAGNASPLAVAGPVERPDPEVVFHAGAEDGLGAWTATGLWHVTEQATSSGQKAYWYGQEATGDYDTAGRTAGELTSPVIDLGAVTGAHLVFDEWVEVESGSYYDHLTVEVYDTDTGAVTQVAGKQTGSTGGFHRRLVDLGAFDGHRVQLVFRFDSVDSAANSTMGWIVDDVTLMADGAATPAELLVNEVLADPPNDYDTNGDGDWSYRDDEMIELVNIGGSAIDLSGATLSDEVRVRLTIPDGTSLDPGAAMVVFGGGDPPAIPGVVTLSASGLYLNNDGDAIRIRAAGGELLAELSYGVEGGRNVSLVRQTDADPASPMVPHDTVSSAVASPGTRSDGAPF